MNGKKIMMTGASGFLGAAVCEKLCHCGGEVTAIVRRNSENGDWLKGLGVKILRCDLSESDKPDRSADPANLFLHFGWNGTSPDKRNDRAVQQSNVAFSLDAVNAAYRQGCGTFIFAGSQAEYGRYDEKIKEDFLCDPVSEYGKAKLEAAYKCADFAAKKGMNFLHLRIFNVYGARARADSLVMTCVKAFESGRTALLGDCSQRWNYLYIKDFSEIIRQLIINEGSIFNENRCVTVNIGSGDDVPLSDYVKMIYEASSKKGEYRFGVLPPNAEGSPSEVPDFTKMLRLTGYSPVYSFCEGIREVIDDAGK